MKGGGEQKDSFKSKYFLQNPHFLREANESARVASPGCVSTHHNQLLYHCVVSDRTSRGSCCYCTSKVSWCSWSDSHLSNRAKTKRHLSF